MSHLSIGKAILFQGVSSSCTGQSCWMGGGGTMGLANRLGPLGAVKGVSYMVE